MLRIFHSVNAGLYLWNGTSGLLIDSLHKGKAAGFSDMPEKYRQMMEKKQSFFRRQNDLLFTHTHWDHYDSDLVDEFVELNPDCKVYGPAVSQSNLSPIPIADGVDYFEIRDYKIYSFWTEHDGKQYADHPHCSYLISCGDELIWISGDALFDADFANKLHAQCHGKSIDAAFVNVYQIGNRKNLAIVKELNAKQVYLYHLPYPEDDTIYYRLAKGSISRSLKSGLAVERLKLDSFVERM